MVVSFATLERINTYLKYAPSPFTFVRDPERKLYEALGLHRGSVWEVFSPKTLLKYVGFALRGKFPEKPTEDIRQLGGDFLFDGNGKLRFSYPSRTPADRPAVSLLLEELSKLGTGR
jgi:hypothetical protein